MVKNKIEKSPLSENLHHVGIVVCDMDKACEYYESLGIGPFEPLLRKGAVRKLRGKTIDDIQIEARIAYIGKIMIELIQPIAGKESIWREFLEKHGGDGVHHLCFSVEDIEKATADMIRRGINIVFTSKFKNGGGSTYLETDGAGGINFELIQHTDE